MFGYSAFIAFGAFRAFRSLNVFENLVRLVAVYLKYNLFNSQTHRFDHKRSILASKTQCLGFKRNTPNLVRMFYVNFLSVNNVDKC